MGEEEVIERLTEHLKAKKQKNGRLCRNDKFYCIYYVMGFLLLNKKDAIKFINKHFPEIADFK